MILTRMAEGAKISWSEQQQLQQLQQEQLQASRAAKGDEDDDEDEFMAEFRAKRLAQLKATSALPKFDTVYEVSSHDFVEQIERVDKRIWVIVHLYEPDITVFQLLTTVCFLFVFHYGLIELLPFSGMCPYESRPGGIGRVPKHAARQDHTHGGIA